MQGALGIAVIPQDGGDDAQIVNEAGWDNDHSRTARD